MYPIQDWQISDKAKLKKIWGACNHIALFLSYFVVISDMSFRKSIFLFDYFNTFCICGLSLAFKIWIGYFVQWLHTFFKTLTFCNHIGAPNLVDSRTHWWKCNLLKLKTYTSMDLDIKKDVFFKYIKTKPLFWKILHFYITFQD